MSATRRFSYHRKSGRSVRIFQEIRVLITEDSLDHHQTGGRAVGGFGWKVAVLPRTELSWPILYGRVASIGLGEGRE